MDKFGCFLTRSFCGLSSYARPSCGIRPLCGFYKFIILDCICPFYGHSKFWILICIRPFYGLSKFWILVCINPFYGFKKKNLRVVCHLGDLVHDFYLSQSSLEDHLDCSSPRSFITSGSSRNFVQGGH